MKTPHALALACLVAAGPATAWNAGGEELPGERLERHLDALELDPATREALNELVVSARREGRAHRRQMRSALRELQALMDVDEPDERAVMAQVERIGALRTEGHKLLIGTLLQIRERLTPEQRDELRDLMRSERRERWRSRGRR